jgi:hypothetical protein
MRANKAPFLLHEGKLKGLNWGTVWWAAGGLNLKYVPASGTERDDDLWVCLPLVPMC